MSKVTKLKAEYTLAAFRDYFGGAFEKLCATWNSELGRLEKDTISEGGNWKSGAKGKMTSKEGHTIYFSLNNPLHQLVRYGNDIYLVADKGSTDKPVYKMDIQSMPPFCARIWADEFIAKGNLVETVA